MEIKKFWEAVITQKRNELKSFFDESATIKWHNTNELFSVDEFVEVNCTYPDEWIGNIEKLIMKDNLVISVVRIRNKEKTVSFHVTSFIEIKNDKIIGIDEYWGEDGEIPEWRKKIGIGKKID